MRFSHLLPAAVLAAALVSPRCDVRAQVRTADPIARGLQLSAFPRLIRLADNVYGYEEIRSPGFTTVSLIVIGSNGVLIADGQGNAAATRKMLDMIKTVTPLAVKWYVVGSDHNDHTGGNSVLPKDVRMVAHRTSATTLSLDSASVMRLDHESIDLGGLVVDVVFLGRAHTGGDLSVYVRRDRILFMSEAYLNRVFPAMRSAYPTEWIATVDRALVMDVTRFVPGHGFIEEPARSREELVAFRKSLVDVIGEVRRLHATGISADSAAVVANWGEYKDWFIAAQQAPIAVRRVYEELAGRLK